MHRIRLFLLACALFTSGFVAADEWIYVTRGSSYAVIDPSNGRVVHSDVVTDVELSSQLAVVPTPGGRYVFLYSKELRSAYVIDAQTHELVRAETLPPGISSVQFNSMGEELVALRENGSRLSISHRKGELGAVGEWETDFDSARVAFNRRATRVYGSRGPDLEYVLAIDGSVITSVDIGGSYDWSVSPGFRFLLGSDDSGTLVLVDEQRARIVGRRDGYSKWFAFTADSREVHALSSGGGAVGVLDTRRFREERRISLRVPLSQFWMGTDGSYHGVSADGAAVVIDASGKAIRVSPDLPGEGPLHAAYVVIRPDEGFACF